MAEMPSPTMSAHDLIALEAAREIMELSPDIPEGRRKALVQCIVVEAIRRATSSDMAKDASSG